MKTMCLTKGLHLETHEELEKFDPGNKFRAGMVVRAFNSSIWEIKEVRAL